MSFLRGPSRIGLPARLGENSYPILALLLATGIRLLPVALSWPYAVGWDTTALYIPAMLHGPPTLNSVFTYPGLHFLILWSAYQVGRQPFLILDTLGILLQSGLALSSYLYARTIVSLDKKTAFLTSLVFTLSPITLRLTWDQYRMSFCLIAIMIAFVVLRTKSNAKKSLVIPLTVLVILSNPLPSVFLLISLIVYGTLNYLHKQSFAMAILASAIGLTIFGVQQISVTSQGLLTTTIPLASVNLSAGTSEVAYGIGFLIFTSWPLLLFLPFGYRLKENWPHTSWLHILIFFAILLVIMGVYTIPTPFIYLMASFPLAMFVGSAVKKFQSDRRFKVLFAFALIFLAVNAVTYVSSSPLNPTGYALLGQSFKYYIPLGYLQSTVPLNYQKNLVRLLADSMTLLPAHSVLYLPRQFYGLALLTPNPHGITIVDIGEINPWLASPFNSIRGSDLSFAIWFVDHSGWYGISSIPSDFTAMQFQGQFALYQIAS